MNAYGGNIHEENGVDVGVELKWPDAAKERRGSEENLKAPFITSARHYDDANRIIDLYSRSE